LHGLRWLRILGEVESDSGAPRLFGTVQDVTAQRETEAEMKRLATTDNLTGLPNRYALMKTIDETLRSGGALRSGALLLLDLDDFKDVNDSLGHDAGDRLLSVLARRLKSCLRDSDAIGRLGGDEFGILLRSDRTANEVASIAQLMLEAATAPVSHNGHSLRVGASVGIARFPEDAANAEALLKHADMALYSAKRHGGERCFFYNGEIGREVERRAMLMQEVRSGLQEEQFTVAYQPIINLRDGLLRGTEALVRWNHPTRGLLTAGAFRDALEEPSLGRLLSYEAMEIAIAQFAAWRKAGLHIPRLGLNISAGQIRDGIMADRLLALLSNVGLGPKDVSLEITEGVLLGRGSENVVRRLNELHDFGVRIALDDFGTGFASLTHLRQLPIDALKIDASFVQAILTESVNRTIVKTVIDMAHGLGMDAIAEGVEGPEVDAVIKLMGCDAGQGYFYSCPLLADEVLACVSPFLRAAEPMPRKMRARS
jgi:diguanylate cyclase (GGDEF)-like protein